MAVFHDPSSWETGNLEVLELVGIGITLRLTSRAAGGLRRHHRRCRHARARRLGGPTNPPTAADLFAGMGRFFASIPQGADRERVDIVIKADAAPEANETITFALVSSSAGTVETAEFSATILKDDALLLPVVSIAAERAADAEGNAPMAAADGHTVDAGGTLVVSGPGLHANDTDADGDALSLSRPAYVGAGTLTPAADGSFTYTPAAGFVGTDTFTYRAFDGFAASADTAVTITVVGNNAGPAERAARDRCASAGCARVWLDTGHPKLRPSSIRSCHGQYSFRPCVAELTSHGRRQRGGRFHSMVSPQ